MNLNWFSIFQQPYPAPKGSSKEIWITLLFGLFIAVFLLFFRPFDLNNQLDINTNWAIVGYGIITSLVLFTFLVILPHLFPFLFKEQSWTVAHQVFFYGFILFVISTANGLYINYLYDYDFQWKNYGWIIMRTFILGSIPITVITLINYNQKWKRHAETAAHLSPKINSPAAIENTWTIALAPAADFTIRESNFLFAKADGNYVQIHHEEKKELYRITLIELERQLKAPYLRRCHRSYLVNLKKVKEVTGNAQGLQLHLKNDDSIVPVSRKYISIIKSYFEKE